MPQLSLHDALPNSPNLTMVVHLLSPDNRYDTTYLRNYAVLNIKDRLARIPGVGDVIVWGAGNYAMRVWLDPQKVAQRHLTASDVVAAIREQNVQVAAGVIGGSPNSSDVPMQLSVNTHGRLHTADDFSNIVLKTRSEEHTSELQSLMRISYAVFCLTKKN